MATGRIRLLSNGFGVISEGRGRGAIVFEREDVIELPFESLRPKQLVEYTPVKGPKGWRAKNVRAVPDSTAQRPP